MSNMLHNIYILIVNVVCVQHLHLTVLLLCLFTSSCTIVFYEQI